MSRVYYMDFILEEKVKEKLTFAIILLNYLVVGTLSPLLL